MPLKRSPKKRVKTVFGSNDDKEVQNSVNRSDDKEVKNSNDLINGNMSESTDEDNKEPISPFKKIEVKDNYFMAQSVRSKTSKNSFSKVMQNFDLSEEKINEIIENQFVSERKQLIDSYKEQYFKKWSNLLKCDFNVLLFGVGSKRKLIDVFIEEYLQREHHIVINGFNNEISVRNIISVLSEAIDQTITDESELINNLKDIDSDLYIVIHSIDNMFNNPKIKAFFLELVSKCKGLRLMATTDHINSNLLWSSTQTNIYKWIWFNVPTFQSYTIEKAFSKSSISQLSGSSNSWTQSLTYSSIKHVYDSLTSNAQKIFLLILNDFIKSDSNNGFSFSDCYTLCREEFLVNSEMTLRAQLSEFKDHKLLKLKKGSDGGEVIIICIDKSVAQKFNDNHK